ncbi:MULTISPECIES: hypothetical protein [Streptomyces]|uniref:Transcription regulator HTH AraC- type ligand binding domain-containing protein n=1 Tax=Streptomyces fimbriatus TaxID=68197 RepID=A0ABW0DKX2_STRFI
MPLEAGQITHLSHASVVVQRTPGFIRRSDPEMYHAALAVHGEVGIEQCRQNSLLHPGGVGFFDSSQPFETFTGSAPARTVIFQFPENLLRVPERHFAGSRGRALPTTEGLGCVLTKVMERAVDQYRACTARDAAVLSATILDLLTAFLRNCLDGEGDRRCSSVSPPASTVT